MLVYRKKMTKELKILKKVKELSDKVADFIADPKNPDKAINITLIDLGGKENDVERSEFDMLIENDFKVVANVGGISCRCNYGREEISCHSYIPEGTKVYDSGKYTPKAYFECLFNSCNVRKYLSILVEGLRRQKPQE